MPRYIVDASVVAKWVLPGEPCQNNAIALKESLVSGKAKLSAPSFAVHEVANSLWKAIERGRISCKDAKTALFALQDLQISLHEFGWASVSEALDIACELDLAIYDCAYLLLSKKLDAALITADDELFEKAKKHFKILHIKDYLQP
jgi:predicted nucleic acid-binding protein